MTTQVDLYDKMGNYMTTTYIEVELIVGDGFMHNSNFYRVDSRWYSTDLSKWYVDARIVRGSDE